MWLRAGGLPSLPIPAAFWPVVGSIFMFRLMVYVYDLRHASTGQQGFFGHSNQHLTGVGGAIRIGIGAGGQKADGQCEEKPCSEWR